MQLQQVGKAMKLTFLYKHKIKHYLIFIPTADILITLFTTIPDTKTNTMASAFIQVPWFQWSYNILMRCPCHVRSGTQIALPLLDNKYDHENRTYLYYRQGLFKYFDTNTIYIPSVSMLFLVFCTKMQCSAFLTCLVMPLQCIMHS